MTKSYLIQAWCIRPFIAYLDPVEAETPEEAIAIARRLPENLVDTAEECNGLYPWDEFVTCDEYGNELLPVLDAKARLREAAPAMRDTLLYVAQVLADFKPDLLRNLGLDVALEQVEKALAIPEDTNALSANATAPDDQN